MLKKSLEYAYIHRQLWQASKTEENVPAASEIIANIYHDCKGSFYSEMYE
jgi:hypothetical protein